jgi:hypothetical protein
MKIIDKTPLVNEKGQLGPFQRIQGMLQYGFSWPYQLAAQQAIITYFDRQLEKGYTLIRNHTLGKSGIMVPIILIGSAGLYVIQIAHERGRYEVKGDSWNVASGEGYQPAPTNPVKDTIRMANAVKAFIERQGIQLPVPVEPVLIAGDPGLHVESVKAAIKVLMIDGIRSYVANLAAGRPVLGSDMIYELTERIINPRPPRKNAPAAPPKPRPIEPERPSPQDVAQAQAIFETSQEVKPFLPGDYDFAMDDEQSADAVPASPSMEASPAQPLPRPQPQPRGRRILGMTPFQLGVVAALGAAFVCVLAVFAYVVFF